MKFGPCVQHLASCARFVPPSHVCAIPSLPRFPRQLPQVIMSSQSASSSSTPRLQSSRKLRFGTTHVVQPKGEHRATVVWLHGLGDVGASWAEVLEDLPLQNIKWIVPTAPIQPVAVMAGFPCNAWFDVGSLSEDGPNDLEGLDASAAHVAGLLSQESSNDELRLEECHNIDSIYNKGCMHSYNRPHCGRVAPLHLQCSDRDLCMDECRYMCVCTITQIRVKLGVGGFSQGAATSLYTTVCSMIGSYSDGTEFPCKLDITVGISGWLPSATTLRSRCENSKAKEQARGYSIFLGHGTNDDIVLYKFGEKSAATLQSLGFSSLTFKTYKGLGHYTNPVEMKDICDFFKEKLHLQA